MVKKFFILLILTTVIFNFAQISLLKISDPFFGICPYADKGDLSLYNDKLFVTFSKKGILENIALKQNMFDAIKQITYSLNKKKISISSYKILDENSVEFIGSNGIDNVKILYTLKDDHLNVKVYSEKLKDLRILLTPCDFSPILMKGKNFHFVQAIHVAYGIEFPNSRSLYTSGMLIIVSRKPKNNEYFEFNIYVDKDIDSLKTKLNLVDKNKYIEFYVVDENDVILPFIKIVASKENEILDVSTVDKNGKVRFHIENDDYEYSVFGEEYLVNKENDKLVVKLNKTLDFRWKPYLTYMSTNSVYVGFRLTRPATAEIIVEKTNEKIKDDLFDTFHMVKIRNLKPNEEYKARILINGSSAIVKIRTFKDKNFDSFKFLVYGDTRTNEVWHNMVCEEMAKENADLVLHTGDLVTSGDFIYDWDSFFRASNVLYYKTPLFPSLGNHERNHIYYYQAFMTPKGGGDYFKRWYSFDVGPVHFIILDSDVPEGTGLDKLQLIWLEEDLKKTKKPFKIVVFHHPLFTNSPREVMYRESWDLLFKKYKVSVVFNGHIHHYERFYKDGVTYVTTGGGGAPLGFGLKEAGRDHIPFTKAEAAGYLHYVVGEVKGNKIYFKVKAVAEYYYGLLSKSNRIIDEFVVVGR